MANIQSRASVVALKVETTEGTPVSPTSANDYLPVRSGYSLEFNQDVLENEELKNSLGPAKPVLGLENPSASLPLYLKHSGTEGQAPRAAGDLLQAIFGTESVRSTERDTVAGSTVSVLNVDSGEGAEFARGDLVLVKDATNGYSIRPVHSVATDALTLGFDLDNAPASGVNLGKSVMYRPATTGHQTLTLWDYLGNSGAIKMITGARVTELSVEFAAGQFVTADYSLNGIAQYFNPIEITSSTKYLDFDEGGSELSAQVTAKFYKDPHQLADALQTAMNDLATASITVTYSDTTGKYTITSDGATFNLLWSTGTNTANTIGTKIGFAVAADDSGATTYTSDNALDYAAPQTPSYDSAVPLVAKNNEVLFGESDDTTCVEASSVSFTLGLEASDVESVCAESGKSGTVPNARTCSVEFTALLQKYDADKFRRYREGTTTRFFYAFGSKSGGNWEAGKCGGIYLPSATVSSLTIEDADGLVAVNVGLTAYVDNSGNGEVYLGFV